LKPVLKATDAAPVHDGPTTSFVTGCLKIFPRRAFSDRLGVRNEGALKQLSSSFFRRICVASVHRNQIGVTPSAASNYQTRESPDEDGLICRKVGPNIPI
jgi:hypothetical protein